MDQLDERAARVHDHADGVEAQLRRARSLVRLCQPGGAHGADLLALAVVERLPRRARARAAGLDLAEDQRLVVGGDEVDLAEAGAGGASEDAVAQPLEVLGGEPLAEAAERLAGVARLLRGAVAEGVSGVRVHDPLDARRDRVSRLSRSVTTLCRNRLVRTSRSGSRCGTATRRLVSAARTPRGWRPGSRRRPPRTPSGRSRGSAAPPPATRTAPSRGSPRRRRRSAPIRRPGRKPRRSHRRGPPLPRTRTPPRSRPSPYCATEVDNVATCQLRLRTRCTPSPPSSPIRTTPRTASRRSPPCEGSPTGSRTPRSSGRCAT